MLVYQRYISQNIIPPLIMTAFVLTSLVWLTQALKLLYLLDKGIRLADFFGLILLVVPALLFMILPFITILAVIYSYNCLAEERQLIILKSSGLSNFELAKPALFIAFLTTLFAYYISFQLMPWSYNKLKSELILVKESYAANIIKEKTFNQVSNFVTIYFDKKLPKGVLQGVVLFDNHSNNSVILFAKTGKYTIYGEDQPIFELTEGIRQSYDSNGNLTTLHFDYLSLKLTDYKKTIDNSNSANRDVNEYYIQELFNPNNKIPEVKKIKLIAEGHQRIIWPLYNFALTFLALAVFLKQPYNKKSCLRQIVFTVSAVILVTYYHFTLQNMATKDLDFAYASYINLIISIIFSIWLYSRKIL